MALKVEIGIERKRRMRVEAILYIYFEFGVILL